MTFKLSDLSKVFFCTGARNHSLLGLFPEESIQFECDERMASFKALGFSKGKKTPVGICTTSGTAVSECVSAMLEAKYSEAPLVLITGDRPKKMHGTGAPQTIEHEPLTHSARGSFFEIPLPELSQFEVQNPQFPIHINVLVDDTKEHDHKLELNSSIESFEAFAKKVKHPLFIVSHESNSMRPFLLKLSGMNLPFYAETMSGGHDLSSIRTEKKLIELFQSNTFDSIIRIGHTPLSKVWRLLEMSPLPVFSFDSRGLPGLSFGEVAKLHSQEILNNEKFWKCLENFEVRLEGDDSVESLMNLLTRFPESEPAVMKRIHDALPYDGRVYLGNSLIVRFFELIQTKRLRVEGNRGVNGIDGQLSTAIGLAQSVNEPVYCILGDITTRYDLSALRDMPENLRLIILNNGGGRIFDFLKLDKRIVMEHGEDFQKISEAFGRTYSKTLSDIKTHQIIELHPIKEETEKLLSEWK